MPLVLETAQSLQDWVGREIAVTEWFKVSQDHIQRFADVIDDQQWIHVDIERAQSESPYGTTIAHGFLILSLLSRLIRQAIHIRSGFRMAVNYGFNRVRFPAAVRAESKIRAHFTARSLKELPGAVEAIFDVTVEAHGTEKPCCVAERVVRYYT